MCDSTSCQRNHNIITKFKDNNDIVIPIKEFKIILCCLVEERNVCCGSSGKCHECKKILYFIDTLKKIEWEVRQVPNRYIRMLQFNKLNSKLELYYSKSYKNYEDALKDNVFCI